MNGLATINLFLALLLENGPVSKLIDKARAEGRKISQAEWDGLFADNDEARAELVAAIEKAQAEGR